MKNNKFLIYLGLVVVGIFLGWLVFSADSDHDNDHDNEELAETDQMWTCSMHPQIMQPEPGDCPICGMDLIPAEPGADGLALNEIKMTDNAVALANIQTTIIGSSSSDGERQMSLSGKIKMNEEEAAVQASYFDGRIEGLNINYVGQEVRKGQLLATIYSPTLIAAQQELITAASLKESQPSLYKAVRNKLKLLKLSDSQITGIEESGTVKENFPVYATVSGTVSEKMVAEGDYVKQGQPIVKVSNLNTVWAEFDAYENQISELSTGQPINVVTNAYPNKNFKATISFIDPVLDVKTRTITVRANLKNNDGLLKPGMFITGKVEGLSKPMESSLMIPATAVLWTGERSLVYVKTNPNEAVFEMREVVLGNRSGDMYEVISGIDDGEEIVTNGTFTVDAAAQLQGKRSMMNTEGKTTLGQHNHNNTGSSASNDLGTPNEARIEVPQEFVGQLHEVYNEYIAIKDALVKDKTSESSLAAENLLSSLEKVNMGSLDKAAHDQWMPLANGIKSAAAAIAKNSDLNEQRNHFKELSSQLIRAVQTFGVDEKVYLEYCPMADNNKGAYWLSKEEKVINPYFGDAMLSCGEVKQVIE